MVTNDEIRAKDILPHKTSFASGDGFYGDGDSSFFMEAPKLLELTAQNTIAGNVAPAFDTTRDEDHKYLAGESVVYNGKTYTFKVDHYGAWAAADVYQLDENDVLSIAIQDELKGSCGKNLFNKNSSNKYVNAYIGYDRGVLIAANGYNVYIINVGAGVDLAFNKNSLHVAAFSGKVLVDKETVTGTPISGYISGFLSDASHRTWTTPAGCNSIAVSMSSSQVGSLQVEIGTESTSYEDYKFGVKIGDVFSLQDCLDEKLNGAVGKNIFNKDTANRSANGIYVVAGSGYVGAASNWKAYAIEVAAGEVLSFNKSSVHVCAFDQIPDLTSVSPGDSIAGRTGGFNDEAKQGWVVPNDTKCIVVSCSNTNADRLQVEKGSVSTPYAPWVFGLPAAKVIGIEDLSAKTYFVGSGMQYETIQSAVNAVPDKSTIIIMPGTYDEAVDVVTSGKMLHIVGFNRDKCIVTHPIDDYYTPPLEIAKGLVENLTFVTTGTTQQGLGAYCVHIDYPGEQNQALQFKNCKFKNTWRPCVGIGLRENFILSFVGCSFESYATYSPIYCHEQQESDKENQRIEIIDCSIYNSASNEVRAAITLQETSNYTGNTATILMQRCIMKSAKGAYSQQHPAIRCIDYSSSSQPSSGGGKYLDSHTWNLDYMSEMNTEAIANASEQ